MTRFYEGANLEVTTFGVDQWGLQVLQLDTIGLCSFLPLRIFINILHPGQ